MASALRAKKMTMAVPTKAARYWSYSTRLKGFTLEPNVDPMPDSALICTGVVDDYRGSTRAGKSVMSLARAVGATEFAEPSPSRAELLLSVLHLCR